MDRYKVESISKDGKRRFIVICTEEKFEYYKQICKSDQKEDICFYRKYPLTKAKKIYF